MKYSKETSTLLQDAGLDAKNVGSSEAQIALLTDRIRSLTEHVKMHKKDVHSKHGLVKLVSQRKKLLKYLRKTKLDSYDELIKKLNEKTNFSFINCNCYIKFLIHFWLSRRANESD